LIILQTNRREDFDIVGYGECPGCKTENNLVQSRTIECSMCGEPYLKNKWKGVSWCE
jgi:RNA polymerase subunit RPABC4/transcription elongation factor Spt4